MAVFYQHCPLVSSFSSLLKIAIERVDIYIYTVVDLPAKNGSFPVRKLLVDHHHGTSLLRLTDELDHRQQLQWLEGAALVHVKAVELLIAGLEESPKAGAAVENGMENIGKHEIPGLPWKPWIYIDLHGSTSSMSEILVINVSSDIPQILSPRYRWYSPDIIPKSWFSPPVQSCCLSDGSPGKKDQVNWAHLSGGENWKVPEIYIYN